MKLYTKTDEVFELDTLISDMDLLKGFITDYQLTVSSQQKLILLYYENEDFDNCLELLKFCISENAFSPTDLEKLNLMLLSFYVEQSHNDKYLHECTKLFMHLENTKFKDELDYIKGFFFYYGGKYDTALFLLKNDDIGRNLIYLSTNSPVKVETDNMLLKGYKAYLENDTKTAISCFKTEYLNNGNKRVFPYLIRLCPSEFSYKNADEWSKNTLEYKLAEKKYSYASIDNELFATYGDAIRNEFSYENGKKLHRKKLFEEAVSHYIQCNTRRADYQVKRILGLPFEERNDLNMYYNLKKIKKTHSDPISEFHYLKTIKQYLDDATYYNNRGYCLYYIDNINEDIKTEIKDDLNVEDTSRAIFLYFTKAKEACDIDQKDAIMYNIKQIGKVEYEHLEDDLRSAIINVHKNPNKSLETFVKYTKHKNSIVAAKGIGIVLALKNDPFCIKIFKHFKDNYNLNVFLNNQHVHM